MPPSSAACAERREIVDSLPYWFHIHLNEPCNQRCIMCKPSGNHGERVLPFESFLAFFDAIKPYAEHLTLIGGEPLLYPWIGEVLDVLAEWPIGVTINTNMTMIDDRMIDRLLRLHLLELKCSIDAATPETYLRIRGRNHFRRASTRLARLVARIDDVNRVRIIPVFVVMRENLHEAMPFIDFACEMRAHRVEFHPVRHVTSWRVQNGTGWTFDGSGQSCEAFRDEYNAEMERVGAACAQRGLACEINLL